MQSSTTAEPFYCGNNPQGSGTRSYRPFLWETLVYNCHTGASCWNWESPYKNGEDSWEQNWAQLITFAQHAGKKSHRPKITCLVVFELRYKPAAVRKCKIKSDLHPSLCPIVPKQHQGQKLIGDTAKHTQAAMFQLSEVRRKTQLKPY